MITKKNAAALTVATLMAALGIGGVVSANAAGSSPAPKHTTVETTEQSDGDGEANDATETADQPDKADKAGSDGESNDDATDTGPDANPNEPGHQDSTDK